MKQTCKKFKRKVLGQEENICIQCHPLKTFIWHLNANNIRWIYYPNVCTLINPQRTRYRLCFLIFSIFNRAFHCENRTCYCYKYMKKDLVMHRVKIRAGPLIPRDTLPFAVWLAFALPNEIFGLILVLANRTRIANRISFLSQWAGFSRLTKWALSVQNPKHVKEVGREDPTQTNLIVYRFLIWCFMWIEDSSPTVKFHTFTVHKVNFILDFFESFSWWRIEKKKTRQRFRNTDLNIGFQTGRGSALPRPTRKNRAKTKSIRTEKNSGICFKIRRRRWRSFIKVCSEHLLSLNASCALFYFVSQPCSGKFLVMWFKDCPIRTRSCSLIGSWLVGSRKGSRIIMKGAGFCFTGAKRMTATLFFFSQLLAFVCQMLASWIWLVCLFVD